MPWNQSEFDELLRKKYEILGQQANADTTRANATAQDVAQKPGMQGAADTAAMDRARLAAQTQTNVAGINESGAMDRTGMATRAQREIAAMQDQGATARTGMQAGTQMAIAGMDERTKRTQLAEDSYLKRQGLTRPVTIYDQDGMKSSTPGVDFSRPANVGMESPLDEEARKRRSAAAGIAY